MSITSGSTNQNSITPKRGERYYCGTCGMSLEITKDCECNDPEMVQLKCCGQEMQRPPHGSNDAIEAGPITWSG